jgi:hypothetical protein
MGSLFKHSSAYCYYWSEEEFSEKQCTNFHYNSIEGVIESGESPALYFGTYELNLYLNVKQAGKINIEIKFDSTITAWDEIIGYLYVYTGKEYFTFQEFREEYSVIELSSSPGVNFISIVYSKNNLNEFQNFKATIRKISVTNAAIGPFKCQSCPVGKSPNLVRSSCDECPSSYYLDQTGICQKCPTNTTSIAGSEFISSCYPLPQCNKSHIIERYSQCINNSITLNYIFDPAAQCYGGILPYSLHIDCEECPLGKKEAIIENIKLCTQCDENRYRN